MKVRTPARLDIFLYHQQISIGTTCVAAGTQLGSNRRLAQPSVGVPPSFSANARGASGDGLLAGGAAPAPQTQRLVLSKYRANIELLDVS